MFWGNKKQQQVEREPQADHRSNKQYLILQRILDGDSSPQADPVHPDTQDFSDFVLYVENGGV